MNEYAKRKEVLGKYEGVEIPNPLKNTPGPEMINFDASGFVTLRYNYKENENEFKCREVRLYYSYEGSGLSALLGLAKGKVKSMDSPSAKDKPEKLPNSFQYSIELKEEQMNKVIEKIDSFNHARYRLFSNNRIDFLKAVAKEVQNSSSISSFSSSQIEQLQLLEQAYEKSNIRNGLFRYRKGDMSRTNSFLTVSDIKNRLYDLTSIYTDGSNHSNFNKMSQKYMSAVDKAREYLKNIADSEEEQQNKVIVEQALDKCINAYKTDLTLTAKDISKKLDNLTGKYARRSKGFESGDFAKIYKDYASAADEARKYIENVGDSKEEWENKYLVQEALNECTSAYKADLQLTTDFILDKLYSVEKEYMYRNKNSKFDEFAKMSKEYMSAVDKARKYLKSVGDSEEEQQRKAIVKEVLDKCISAYKTNSHLTSENLANELNGLTSTYIYRFEHSEFDEFETTSKEYELAVDKAQEYLDNAGNSKEEKQNKVLVQEALDKCTSAYKTNSRLTAENLANKLDSLEKNIRRSGHSEFDNLETISKEYVLAVDKAQEYLDNAGNSSEAWENKYPVNNALRKCEEAYKSYFLIIADDVKRDLDLLTRYIRTVKCVKYGKNMNIEYIEFTNFEKISEEYVPTVDKARICIKTLDALGEQQQKSYIKEALDECTSFYKKSSFLVARDTANDLNNITLTYKQKSDICDFDEFEAMSKTYLSVVDQARKYLKIVDNLEEERQNKGLVNEALNQCISTCSVGLGSPINSLKEKLDYLTYAQNASDRQGKVSEFLEIEKASLRYASVINKAKEYLKNTGDSEEERQNKILIKEALDKCMSAYGGSMRDEVSDVSVLDDKSIEIKTGDDVTDKYLAEDMQDVRDWPLFPWRPCISDIRQGKLGDCWLEAALASLVNKDPKYIEDSLRDNQDGTVTGRIYEKDENSKSVKPRYYKVTKSIPHLSGYNSGLPAFSDNACLWPEMVRKILIKHIENKGGRDVADGTFVTKPTYRWLNGGAITNPETEIFQFFTPSYVETDYYVTMRFRSDVITSSFKKLSGRVSFNSNQRESIIKSFLKCCSPHSEAMGGVSYYFSDEKPGSMDRIISNIEAYYNGLITYEEFIKECSPLLKHDILSDERVSKLLEIKEVRKDLQGDINIKEILREIISKELYNSIKSKFNQSGGLMNASVRPYAGYWDQFIDILGEIEKPNSEGSRVEKDVAGLYTNHAYTVIGLEEKDGHYFVKIRNPWGYGQRYDSVTPDGKIESKYDVDGDVGRIEILEFLKYFYSIKILK